MPTQLLEVASNRLPIQAVFERRLKDAPKLQDILWRMRLNKRNQSTTSVVETIEWQRDLASATDLTPIGRFLFPGGRLRSHWWTIAGTVSIFIFHAMVVLVLGTGASLAAFGVAMASSPTMMENLLTLAFFGSSLAAYGYCAVYPAIRRLRLRTRPAGFLIAYGSKGVWIDSPISCLKSCGQPVAAAQTVLWTAQCPICGACLELIETRPDGGSPPVGRCESDFLDHIFSFNRSTLTGSRIAVPSDSAIRR